MSKQKWLIYDWAGNFKFSGKSFKTFDDGEYYLSCYFIEKKMEYEEWRQEYYIELKEEKSA